MMNWGDLVLSAPAVASAWRETPFSPSLGAAGDSSAGRRLRANHAQQQGKQNAKNIPSRNSRVRHGCRRWMLVCGATG